MRRNGIKIIYRERLDLGVDFSFFSAVLDLGLGRVGKIEKIDGLECMHFYDFCLFFSAG